jgi:phosphoglycolate phosphatase
LSKLIIWDWNGTLLNDMDACILSVNTLLEKRRMDTVDYGTYRDIFGFPIIDYYKALGFDLDQESFQTLADEYIPHYLSNARKSELQEGATEVLRRFGMNGYRQIILSAMEIESLREQVGDHDLTHYFHHIIGLDNVLAHGKVSLARDYFGKVEVPVEKVMIGDTYHDYEVASALGCRCVLVKNGHQNLDRFSFGDDVTFIDSLPELSL